MVFLILIWIALPAEGQFHFSPGFKSKNKAYIQKLETFSKNPALSGASWAIVIQNLKTGEMMVRANENLNLIPASNLKLISTLNGLKSLGTDFRFQTKIWTDGPIENGLLRGNLLVEGEGDPSIYAPEKEKWKENFFAKLILLLQSKGIKEIEGHLLEKNHNNPYSGIRSDWSWSDVGNYYGSGIYSININENQYSLYLTTPGEGKPARLKKMDTLVDLSVEESNVQTAPPGNPDLAYIYWVPGQPRISIKGSIPYQPHEQKVKGAQMNPSLLFFQILKRELDKKGIGVKGNSMISKDPMVIGTIESVELLQIAKEINLNSNNLMTEAIGMALCEKGCSPEENGWTHLAKFAQQFSCPPGFYFSDACGLSLSNRISALGMVQALGWSVKQPFFNGFFESLPVSGVSGTMKNFCKSEKAKGKIHAKSGTLNRVLCYSGFAETSDGNVAFSIMLNAYNGSFYGMKKQLEHIMEELPGIQL